MHSMRNEAKATARSKLARLSAVRGNAGVALEGDGVHEDYGNKAAGPSSAARFAHGGSVEGEMAMGRKDRAQRRRYADGGPVKGKGKTIVNINVGQPAGNQMQRVPVPVPVGGPPPQGVPPPMMNGAPPPSPMPMPQGAPGMMPGNPPMPPPQLPMRKRGGRLTAGAKSGEGRLEKIAMSKRRK